MSLLPPSDYPQTQEDTWTPIKNANEQTNKTVKKEIQVKCKRNKSQNHRKCKFSLHGVLKWSRFGSSFPPPTSIATVYGRKVGLNSVIVLTVGCDDLIFVENSFEFS